MNCPICHENVDQLYPHPDGEMCFACGAKANLMKFTSMAQEFLKSLPEKPLQDLSKAETIKAYSAGAALTMPAKNKTQMEMFGELAPHFETQFLTEKKSFVGVAYVEGGSKRSPHREMRVGFYDSKKNEIVRYATFSCS